jgi:hypothetical protein
MTRQVVACLLVLAALSGCGREQPVGPVAGELVVSLNSPGATDGAVLLRLVGEITAVTPVGNYRVESAPIGSGITRIVVAGTITSGPIARIAVPDLAAAAQYYGLVEQVADRHTFALRSTAGYSVSVAP